MMLLGSTFTAVFVILFNCYIYSCCLNLLTVMLRQKSAISALVVDLRTLLHMFDVATSLMWKLFTLSPQVLMLFSY